MKVKMGAFYEYESSKLKLVLYKKIAFPRNPIASHGLRDVAGVIKPPDLAAVPNACKSCEIFTHVILKKTC
jgi:hypothetical protein